MQAFGFTAGKPVNERKAAVPNSGSGGGSFAGASGPKPPPALATSVIGMKKGGKVRSTTASNLILLVHSLCPVICQGSISG